MSNPPPDMSEELRLVLHKADLELHRLSHNPFSVEGFNRLNERIQQYITELIAEALRVAERYKSDSVSPSYVDEASQHLIYGIKSKWSKLIGTISGTIFGIGLTSIITMTTTGQYSALRIVLSTIAIVIGLVGVTYHVLKE
jgi:hypothetical protein